MHNAEIHLQIRIHNYIYMYIYILYVLLYAHFPIDMSTPGWSPLVGSAQADAAKRDAFPDTNVE